MPNDMRDRLIELLTKAQNAFCDVCAECAEDGYKTHEPFEDFFADYLLQNGVILPPCRIGDHIFAKCALTEKIECWVISEVIHKGSNYFDFQATIEDEDGNELDTLYFSKEDFGIFVFLTKQEAREALKGGAE